MPYGKALIDTVESSGNLAITGNVTTTGTLASSAGTIYPLVSGTVQSATGSSVDFTGIPSWVRRITVMFSGLSTSGTSAFLIQLGDSGGIENTGYSSAASRISTTVVTQTSTAGFILVGGALSSSAVYEGSFTISILNASTNLWSFQGTIADTTNVQTQISAGSKSTSGVFDRVRLTTVNGTDTFDAGSVNILYE